MTAIAAERYTGASIKRSEDPRILTGAGRYVDDIKLPGMLHAAFVRSPMAHARVLSVDVSAARALPGVVAVFTGAELEEITVPGPDALMALIGGDGPTPEFTLLASDKVRFAGDPVAIVIAESRYVAEDGCELVEVEYDDLPPVTNASFALDPSSPPLFANLGDNIASPHSRSESGDVAATFAAADRIFDFRIGAIAAERYTGASIKRSEDPRILTGAGRYVDDIKLPGMLHAAFVRSPMAHARVLSVDASAALALPGVVAVLTGAELEAMTVPGPDALMALMGWAGPTPEFTLLATDKVRLVGDPVAVVIAESRYIAEDGCELVEVEYDDLPPVMDAAFALDPGSPPLFANLGDNIARLHSRHEFGDVSATFAHADRVTDFHIDVHRHQNVPMEGRGCVASYDAGSGVMTMHAATQSVHVTRIAAASRQLGQPVKWVEDRGENLTASGQAREESFDVRAAVSNDGDLLGLDVKMVVDTGSYPGMGAMVPDIMEAMLPGPYKLAAMGFESTAVTTNKACYVAYRGPWASETFVRERVLDLIAKDLGLDPVEIRLRNVALRTDPPAVMITGRPLVGVTAKESLERVAHLVDLPGFRRRQAQARAQGRYLGIGVATFIEAAPGPRAPEGPSGPMGMESMRLRLTGVRASPGGPAVRWAWSPCACGWKRTASSRCSPARCRTARATRRPWPRSPPTSSGCRSSRSASWSATLTWCRSG